MIPKEAQAEICECGYAKNMHPIFVSGRKVQEKGEIFLDWICEKFKAQSYTDRFKPLAQKGCGKYIDSTPWPIKEDRYCGKPLCYSTPILCPSCQEIEWKWKRPKAQNHSPQTKQRENSSNTNPAGYRSSDKEPLDKTEGTFNLSEKIFKEKEWIGGHSILIEDVKTFIQKEDKIIIQEINKTDGSMDYNLNNLFQRICIRKNKLAGVDLT